MSVQTAGGVVDLTHLFQVTGTDIAFGKAVPKHSEAGGLQVVLP